MLAIEVSGLSKKFDDFTALEDISFEVSAGETVGIIGSNGAGKSTLLQILSEVLRPTSGRVELVGRVASILEVGTGFHPDLSGRENVYMNGQLLGLSRKEIDSLFDEVVGFSEIGDFIDSPVKHYSSGMYLRLAFSVFSHLRADIVLLDEVMGVGDSAFRKKCEDRIMGLTKSGATVIMVNHDMASISKVCNRCIFLNKGKLIADGPTDEVVQTYFRESNVVRRDVPDMVATGHPHLATFSDGLITIDQVYCQGYEDNQPTQELLMSSTIQIQLLVTKLDFSSNITIILRLDNHLGNPVFADSMDFRPVVNQALRDAGQYAVSIEVPGNLLNHGLYYVSLIIGKDQNSPEFFEQLVQIKVEKPLFEREGNWDFKNLSIRPHLKWNVSKTE